MNWLWTGIMAVLTVVLIFLVLQGAVYVGWALGGIIGVVLAVLLAYEIITDGGFFGGIIGIIVLCILFQWLF
jgi:hypothetical protein